MLFLFLAYLAALYFESSPYSAILRTIDANANKASSLSKMILKSLFGYQVVNDVKLDSSTP